MHLHLVNNAPNETAYVQALLAKLERTRGSEMGVTLHTPEVNWAGYARFQVTESGRACSCYSISRYAQVPAGR